MRIIDSFTDEEKEKLENIGVELRDREYEISELRDIMDIIMDAVMNNLDEDGEFTELAEEYNWIHDKMLQIEDDAMYESENVIIRVYFNDEQIALLEENDIDLDREYTLSDLEKLEDLVYNIMMSNLDENGEFTELAEKYEKIIDVIVKIENEM
ncbi:MAG: hypothetical protein J6K45_02360 [Clostridia bacterium]|nr:hypothetical protein [Clostridia bacterium]